MTTAKGFGLPSGGGRQFNSPTPDRSIALKLLEPALSHLSHWTG